MTPFSSRGLSQSLSPSAAAQLAGAPSDAASTLSRGATNDATLFHRCFFRRAVPASPLTADFMPTADGGLRRTEKMARLEAALLISDGPLSARKLAQYATLADSAEATQLIERLNESFDAGGSAFRIERVASGYQMLTRPAFATWLSRLHQRQLELKLSPPALETLTIVAYRQPITRADIEALRGVQCAEMLKQLMERGLVRIGGEDDSLGRPYLYETTRHFLEIFGLRSLHELPMSDHLRKAGGTNRRANVSDEAESDDIAADVEVTADDDDDTEQDGSRDAA